MALFLLAKYASGGAGAGIYRSWHPLLAASITAYFVFGNKSDGVSEQVKEATDFLGMAKMLGFGITNIKGFTVIK
jgi:hypothetical protein